MLSTMECKTMTQYIALIPCVFVNARELANEMENQNLSKDDLTEIKSQLDNEDFGIMKSFEYYPITDFMELFNDDDIDSSNTYFTYFNHV